MSEAVARAAFTISPSDTEGLAAVTTRGIWVGGTGNLTVQTLHGSQVTFSAVPAGTLVPIVATQVFNTGTSATDLVGLVM